MPPMTNYNPSDIVLVDFGFSEQYGSKKRPALIISSDAYHKNRQELIVAAITSNVSRMLVGDSKVDYWKESGLLHPSVVTAVIRTVKKDIVLKKLGSFPEAEFQGIKANLKKAFSF